MTMNRSCVLAVVLVLMIQLVHGRPQASISELIEELEEKVEEIEDLIDPTHSLHGSHHHHHHQHHHHHRPDVFQQGKPGGFWPVGSQGQGVIPPRPMNGAFGQPVVAPAGLTPGSATAGGSGHGNVENGVATATGTGVAQAGPGGFGIGLGIGISIATPLGNISVGQGESVAVGK